MPKVFEYKGKTAEELRKLGVEEFRLLLPSRNRRALKRGLTDPQKKLLEGIRKDPKKFHKTHMREMVILPEMIGTRVGVHNGKEFVAIDIKPEMLSHRLGEFVLTRKKVSHSAPGFGATKSSKFIPLK